METTERPYVQVHQLRAKDLGETDVIRYNGRWREVLEVFTSEDELTAQYGGDLGKIGIVHYSGAPSARADIALANVARIAFTDAADESYVLVRLLLQESGRPGEIDDLFVRFYRMDLVDVQSLPAYEVLTTEAPGQSGELQYLLGRVLARPDAKEALDYILSVPYGGPSCGCGADHWSCDFGFGDDD